jgi:hypothetical protein
MAENCQMGYGGSPLEDDPHDPTSGAPFGVTGQSLPPFRPQPAPAGEIDPRLAMREPYLRRVLADFEAGRLPAYDYTRRVLAINAAASAPQMAAIVEQLPDGTAGGAGSASPRGLDAVDLALLRSPQLSGSSQPTSRYVALAIVFLLFAVLIGMGVWLASHMHNVALSPHSAGALGVAIRAPGWL